MPMPYYEDDMDLIETICHLADLSMTSETPGVARDDDMDKLIHCARVIRERDGLLVTDGSELSR
jgi:hypothetical protein